MKRDREVIFSRQKAILSFVFLFVAWMFFFMPTLLSIFGKKQPLWLTVSTYGIVIVSLCLIIARMTAIRKITFVSSQLGLLCVFLMAIFFILGQITRLDYVEQSSVILMFPALVMTAFGPLLVQSLLFPLLYLMFIIPLQDETLANRPLIVGVAVLVLIAYLSYEKFTQPKAAGAFVDTTPLWVSMNARWLLPTFIALSMLMVSPWLGENIRSFYPVKQREIALRAPLGTHGWVGPYAVHSSWASLYKNASAILQEQYFSETDKNNIYLYTAYFHSDRDFSDVLKNSNEIYDSSVWKQVNFETMEVKLDDNQTTNVFAVTLESKEIFRVVWYWYYVAGVSTTDLALATFLDKIRVIAKYAQGSGVVAISTTYTSNPTEATDRLKSFLSVMYNSLDVLKRPEIFYTLRNQVGT